MKIAVASSGLGHVSRGIEAWAEDLAGELHRRGEDVTLFQGAAEAEDTWRLTLPCWRRFEARTGRLQRLLRLLGGWRFGLGSEYEIEQATFALSLWRRVHREYDIVHVQDYRVAAWLDSWNRRGWSRPQVILAHGTEEPPELLQRVKVLQHLAPCYLDGYQQHRPPKQRVYAVPNFVDVERFHPGDAAEARREWDLPPRALMILCVAAIRRYHKRVDYLIREVATFARQSSGEVVLVVAGAREADTDAIIQLASEELGPRARCLVSVPRDRIPSLLRAADVFALASLHEMMPIAVLEALASGLPVVASDTPTLRWMTGPAGRLGDLREPGAMAGLFAGLADQGERRRLASAARHQALAHFSPQVVVDQVLSMYSEVIASDRGA